MDNRIFVEADNAVKKRTIVRIWIAVGLLTMLLLTAYIAQAQEEPPASDVDTEAQSDCTLANGDAPTEPITLGSTPRETCVSSEVPVQSYIFSVPAACTTHVMVASSENGLVVTLKDPISGFVLETASPSALGPTFVIPPELANEITGGFLQVDASMGPSAAETESFSISVEDTCSAEFIPVIDLGPPLDIENPVTFPADSTLWSLQHPEGWGAEVSEDGSINLSNDLALLEAVKEDDFVIGSGQVGLGIYITPTELASEIGFEGSNNVERATFLASLIAPTSEESLVTVGEVELLQHAGQPILARVTYGYADLYEGMIIVWDISDDAFGVAVVMTPPGETVLAEDTIYAILESVEFNSPVVNVLTSLTEENQ